MTITIGNYIEPAGADHRETPAASNSDHRAESTAADAELGAANTIISSAQNGSALSGARADLQQSIEQLIEAEAALARVRQPVARLRVLVEDLGRAEQDLVSQRARYDGVVGEWIASGCKGERPEVTPSLVAAERELAEKAADARAAKAALPAHEAVQSEAGALVRDLTAQRDRAQVLAAIEAAKAFCADHLVPAINTFRRAEHVLRNLEDALMLKDEFGPAEQIRQAIAAAKAAEPPKPDIEAGRRFLNGLLQNPALELGQ